MHGCFKNFIFANNDNNKIKIEIRSASQKLLNIFNDYSFYYISGMFDIKKYQTIIHNIENSNCILIDQYNKNDEIFFSIGFNKTIIVTKLQSISLLNQICLVNKSLIIYLLPNVSKDIFNQQIEILNYQIQHNDIFMEEINGFGESFEVCQKSGHHIIQFTKNLFSCLTGYLIKESYLKLSKKQPEINSLNTSNDSCENKITIKKSLNDYAILRNIYTGNFSKIDLVYEIESGEMFVHKTFKDNEENLNEREYENYLQINYPLLPKLHCKIKNDSLIVQFINGKTLKNIDKFHFTFEEKIIIIFQIMLSINYLHEKKFIYRDLKPTNIMIDENKTVYIIDFDRMINFSKNDDDEQHTTDFNSIFAAPEINENKFTDKNDIYSIGQMIYYIMCEKKYDCEEHDNIYEKFGKIGFFILIYKRCINVEANQRPSISDLLFEFYAIFYQQINKYCKLLFNIISEVKYFKNLLERKNGIIKNDINKEIHYFSILSNYNNSNAQLNLGFIYYNGIYIKRDIHKSIYYYTLAANQNDAEAQYALAYIYANGEKEIRDINKSIYFLTLAADQNYQKAQFALGAIKFEDICIRKGIINALNYYFLAANLNNLNALITLGIFYSEGKYFKQDIEKGIHYFKQASEQKCLQAYLNLAMIYDTDAFNKKDIKKAIYYYTLAANQNDAEAQFKLGFLYARGGNEIRDINKSINYYTLAANQNDSYAQYELGYIYANGEKKIRDINKSIYYYSLSANNNFHKAQYNLGIFYLKGEYVAQDINKAIHLFSQAANQNDNKAQYTLGLSYIYGKFTGLDMYKGINFLIQSSINKNREANFLVGYFYHEGKYIEHDTNKMMKYYKEGSTYNDCFTKNNLGILHKNGYGKEIPQNIGVAISYFEDAIKISKCMLSMYNLSHIYIYEDINLDRIDKSIDYLIQISTKFNPSLELLCIAFIKKHKFNLSDIEKDLRNKKCYFLFKMMLDQKLFDKSNFEKKYEYYKNIDFLYDYMYMPILSSNLKYKEMIYQKNGTGLNITKDFYEGFNIDI